ncbi:hypothetical protein SAY87_030456 [Trapa incisa]|uniref:Transcriptional regulator STERILE APETALA n=1 Tax=Trapa incisa TaxID=236973 RepID=A0AAN7QJX1_9MYRT|nr:hypothetical protein SAY87_030456 [Trapa incisa]
MSYSPISHPTSSSSSPPSGVGGNGGRRRRGEGAAPSNDVGPSSSRRRRGRTTDVWPEPFLEALAIQVAVDAARSFGRLAAAPSLANLFQVCSTWRAVSRSYPLWARLTRQIWGCIHLNHTTWREEYVYHHRTSWNFRAQRYVHATLSFDPFDVVGPEGLICRCLTLSDQHLACGFADGTVRLFDLSTLLHVGTYQPQLDGGLGLHPRAVSGIAISGSRLIFATLDGDVHVAMLGSGAHLRRAHMGDVLSDGALVDFAACDRWWVGLYAGVPGRAFHIWDGQTEELVFVGGMLTDPESVRGWQMLTELTQFVARVRVTGHESVVACTSTRVITIHLRDQGVLVLDQRQYRRGLIVMAMDANAECYVVVDTRGQAAVRRVDTGVEVCRRFVVRGAGEGRLIGCMNLGYAMMCTRGVIDVWDVERGEYLYSLAERVEEVNVIVANEQLVAGYCGEAATIHLWIFGAR